MTTTPDRTAAESELAALLTKAAGTFVAELEAQGRLVESGGASALEHLRTQIEARQNLPEAYQAAVDTIVDDCGYPNDVAVRIAQALQRKGLIPGDQDQEHEPQHDRAPSTAPLHPGVRGALVLALPTREVEQARDHTQPFIPERVEGQRPAVRPVAAHGLPADAKPQWSDACARAVTTASRLQQEHGQRPEVMQIAADAERVTVAVKAESLADWDHWLTAIGAPVTVATRTAGYAQLAEGLVDDVEVHLTAHEVPRLLSEAAEAAASPHFLWGRIYDLSRGQMDRHQQVWVYLGRLDHETREPVLVLRGSLDASYPLAAIVSSNGPLTAIDMPAGAPSVPPAGGAR
ncbi:BN159_2729 family protein [Streptomyces sp. NPDC102487]|uniref:BN159_2729 family protein n=1 Tax=Streptomyces sp. NPDC102487 TaxID=3366182 RepID=UPI003827D396